VSYDPAPLPGRIYLYTRPTRSDRAVSITVTVIVILLVLIGIATLSATAYLVMFVLCVFVFLAVQFNMVLRTKAWLEGTTLTVRGAYTSHHCDLAVAAVRLEADAASGMPLLTAQDAAGRSVRLVLRESGRREALAPQKLHALANAIMAGGRQDAAGHQVANSLRSLAGGPAVSPPPYQ
jgi:hypothetical protein